jgi:hypothetical protein
VRGISNASVVRNVRAGNRQAIASNSYLQSLLDPVGHGRGSRIPDLVTLPSSTFTTVTRFAAQSVGGSTGGDIAVAIFPRPRYHYNVAQQAVTGYTWATAGYVDTPELNSITSLFEQVRPVSMAVLVEFIGPTVTDSGSICATLQCRPRGASELGNIPPNYNTLINTENVYLGPLRNGAQIIWLPQDDADLVYSNPSAAYGGSAGGWNDKNFTSVYPYIVVACGEMSSGFLVRFTITVNYEAIADSTNMTFLSPVSSPSNPSMLSTAFNYIRQIGGAVAGPVFKAINSPFAKVLADELTAVSPVASGGVPLIRY